MIKVLAMSDLHGYLPKVDTPCDLILLCGDLIPLEDQGSTKSTKRWYFNEFKVWANQLPCNKVLFISGNHEIHHPNHIRLYKEEFNESCKVTYLCHEQYTYEALDGKEYKIFGTPYCHIFGRWAFMFPDDVLEREYSKIPENLDILMTHDQPYGYGDVLLQKDCPWANGEHIGNKPLAKAVLEKQPRYLFVAHLHSTDHECIEIGNTKRYNVSIKDEFYNPVYKPLYLEIDK